MQRSIYTGCDRTTSWKYRCRPCKIFNSRKQYQRECAASGIKLCKGTLALAHNGNLVNAPELRHELEYTGAIFQTTIDSEVIAYHIARARIHTPTVELAVAEAMKKIKGAYSPGDHEPKKADRSQRSIWI